MPGSPCGPTCVPAGQPRVSLPRAVGRLAAAAGVLLAALLAVPLLVVLRGGARERLVRLVFRAVLRAFGVRMRVFGANGFGPAERLGRGALVVNNHISWLDIVAINAVRPMPALAKSEIASWPLVGRLATSAGTVYLDREALGTLPGTMAELASAMRAGSMVSVTPEGATWCGSDSGRFRPAAFQAAIDGGVPVRPIALRYRAAAGAETTAPAFIGDETLIDSVRRVARLRGLVLEMRVCEEIAPGRAGDRRELAALAEASVNSALGRTRLGRTQTSSTPTGSTPMDSTPMDSTPMSNTPAGRTQSGSTQSGSTRTGSAPVPAQPRRRAANSPETGLQVN
ncbi:MAG: 1-acyl-sn-glycerol-3-phosphate acyltransferase [Pseudonocardiaceae bacterium]|nr:1-acyl-sn-glycerol-3-phosphate acyltransferase [Pseudonocardiaceae bacterium]